MGNLSAEDDSLRTCDVQMEGMHHCARPGWDLQFPTGVKREKGEEKKRKKCTFRPSDDVNIKSQHHIFQSFPWKCCDIAQSGLHTHTTNMVILFFVNDKKKVNFSWDFYYENWQLFDMFS
jgi:hypothetical protein